MTLTIALLLASRLHANLPATPPIDAAEAIAKVRAAQHWDRLADAAPSGVTLNGTVTFLGLDQTATLIFESRGTGFALQQSGPVPYSRGLNEQGPWLHDIGGEVRHLHLGEAESARVVSEVLTGRWTLPADNTSLLRFTTDTARTNDQTVVLPFTLRDGLLSGRVEIDRATWRPASWTFAAPGDPRPDELTLAGELSLPGNDAPRFPANITWSSGNGAAIAYKFESISPAPSYFRSPFAPPIAPSGRAPDIAFDPAKPNTLESKRLKTGHTLVKVAINGVDGWFIFDSGAGGTVIDAAFSDSVGLEQFGAVQAVGIGGSVASSFVRAASLTVGPATQSAALMTRLDLSKIGGLLGEKIDGVLGYNILRRSIARIAPATGRITLSDPAAFNDAGLTWHTLIDYDRHACVQATIEGHTGYFRLDTGAGTLPVSVHAPAVQRLKLLEGRDTTDAKAGGVGGFVKTRSGFLAWLEIGGRRLEHVPASFAVEPKGSLADAFTLGNLSPAQLGPRDIVFDYAGGRIAYPDSNPDPAQPPK
jgi:hypothetical protein